MDYAFGVKVKNSLPSPRHRGVFPFFLRVLKFYTQHMFMIHFELVLYEAWGLGLSSYFCLGCPVVPAWFVKRASSSSKLLSHLCQKSVGAFLMVVFMFCLQTRRSVPCNNWQQSRLQQWEFPGGPVVRTQSFHCHEIRFHLWSGD